MNRDDASLDRKDLARMLNTSQEVLRRAERMQRLGLSAARIDVSKRSIRYSRAALRREKWFRKLED